MKIITDPKEYGCFGNDRLQLNVEPGDIIEGLIRTYELDNGKRIGDYLVRNMRMKILQKTDNLNRFQIYLFDQSVVLNVYINGNEQCLKIDSPSITDEDLVINKANQKFYIKDFCPLTKFYK